MPLGPLMCGVSGLQLTESEREILLHPLIGAVILFTRNYQSPEQLAGLTSEIHALRDPRLLIAVDHEGGRVQRFREGFTRLPPMRELGKLWDANRRAANHLARVTGYVLASELRVAGVDLSFTPVLDIDYGQSTVIRDRALHSDADAIVELAHALVAGLRDAGMAAVGKHFPGHGHIAADSHLELPVDERSLADLKSADMRVFSRMIEQGLRAIMPAHVVYPAVDSLPTGFSRVWLHDILRGELAFDGAIFSDDLGMAAACCGGDVLDRVELALEAGCDMALLCNDSQGVNTLLEHFIWRTERASSARLARLMPPPQSRSLAELRRDTRYQDAQQRVSQVAHGDVSFDPTARNA
jgi:beta-N-acetylhexosaminidase